MRLVSYRLRLTLAIVAVVLPLMFLMSLNRMTLLTTLAYEHEVRRLNSIGQLLANELGENLASKDIPDLQEIIALAAQQPDITVINVVDQQHRILHSSDPGQTGQVSILSDNGGAPPAEATRFARFFPVKQAPHPITLQIEYSLDDVAAIVATQVMMLEDDTVKAAIINRITTSRLNS